MSVANVASVAVPQVTHVATDRSALAEKINLTAGVIGHEGSTVLVIMNGLRLLRSPKRRREGLQLSAKNN